MQNNLVRKSVVFGMVLVMVAVMFAPVTMNVSATYSCAGSTETVANVDRIENATQIIPEESSGEGEAAISFRMEEITDGEHPSAPPRSGSERDGPTMYSPTDSNNAALGDYSPEEECENGCGPYGGGWVDNLVGDIVDLCFEKECNRHDRCYCHGLATYCKDRDRCDQDFCDDMGNAAGNNPFCIALAPIACFAVKEKGERHWWKPEKQYCLDYDNLGGEWECPAKNPTTVYVDGDFTGCPQHGTKGKPVTTVNEGKEKVALRGTVIIAAGSYPESMVISKSMTLKARWGTVVIGE